MARFDRSEFPHIMITCCPGCSRPHLIPLKVHVVGAKPQEYQLAISYDCPLNGSLHVFRFMETSDEGSWKEPA